MTEAGRIDATVVLPTHHRSGPLRRTLASLAPHLIRNGLPVLLGENGGCLAETRKVVEEIERLYTGVRIELLDLTAEAPGPPSISKLLRVVDLLYARVETRYIFHCEDDWLFSPVEFLTASNAILDAYPDITIVRLTGDEVAPYPDCSMAREVAASSGDPPVRFHYSRYGGAGGAFGAFTLNPGLRRRSDYLESFRPYSQFASETEVARHAQRLGHREAILERAFARHIGRGEFHSEIHGHEQRSKAPAPGSTGRCWIPPVVQRGTASGVAASPASALDATSSRGVYHFYDVDLELGRTSPILHFFSRSGSLPRELAGDSASKVWVDFEVADVSARPTLDAEADAIGGRTQHPVYLFLPLANPAHCLEDILFSIALELESGWSPGQPPLYRSFVQGIAGPPREASTDWGLYAHQGVGVVAQEGELLADDRTPGRRLRLRHLVVPKYMRHRFAHDWRRPARGPRRHGYIDRKADMYPLEALVELQRRLFAGCLGEKVVPGPSDPSARRILLHDRGEATCRRWSNGRAVARWIEERWGDRIGGIDFVSEDYAGLSPKQQAGLFRAADIVIAPHGAALANLIYCRPGTVVLELGWQSEDPGWYRFVTRLGMEHHIVRPPGLSKRGTESFDAPVELLADVLDGVTTRSRPRTRPKRRSQT